MMKITKFDLFGAFVIAVWADAQAGWPHDFQLVGAILVGLWVMLFLRTGAQFLWRRLARRFVAGQESGQQTRSLSCEQRSEAIGLPAHGRPRIAGPRGIVLSEDFRKRRDIRAATGQEIPDALARAIEAHITKILPPPTKPGER